MLTRHSLLLAATAAMLAATPATGEEPTYELRGGGWAPATPPGRGTPEGEIALIRQRLAEDAPRSAQRAIRRFLQAYPEHPLHEEAMMLAGDAEMQRGRYSRAFDRFEDQLKQYPRGLYYERALNRELAIGEAFLAGKRRWVFSIFPVSAQSDGVEILQRVATHAPRSSTAEKALLRAGDYHYRGEDFVEAAAVYDEYLEFFDDSPRAPEVMVKAAGATVGSFGGIAYDETPLLDAEQRYNLLIERFPEKAQEAGAADALRNINRLRAQKLYETARFYERTGRPGPAVFYYRQVRSDFPDTGWAEQAGDDLARLGQPGSPGEPTTRPAGEAPERGGEK